MCGEIKFDIYNTAKYQILSAIDVINSEGRIANMASIKEYTGMDSNKLSTHFRWLKIDLVLVRYDPDTTNGCTLKYKLSKQGKHILTQYQERHANGYDLRLRKLPSKMDWSQFELLPGLKG